MDGLTGTVPFYERKEFVQITLFDEYSEDEELIQKACRIYDWNKKKSSRVYIIKEREIEIMKFDFIIGNPPYQDTTTLG